MDAPCLAAVYAYRPHPLNGYQKNPPLRTKGGSTIGATLVVCFSQVPNHPQTRVQPSKAGMGHI